MEKRLTVKVTVERDLHQARVARKVDTAIHRLNHYPVDSVVYFGNTYPWILVYPVHHVVFEQLGPRTEG